MFEAIKRTNPNEEVISEPMRAAADCLYRRFSASILAWAVRKSWVKMYRLRDRETINTNIIRDESGARLTDPQLDLESPFHPEGSGWKILTRDPLQLLLLVQTEFSELEEAIEDGDISCTCEEAADVAIRLIQMRAEISEECEWDGILPVSDRGRLFSQLNVYRRTSVLAEKFRKAKTRGLRNAAMSMSYYGLMASLYEIVQKTEFERFSGIVEFLKDIESAIEAKMQINATRPPMHDKVS